MNCRKPMQLRLPEELKNWIKAESDRNGSSQNSEVIRAIRAAKERRHESVPTAQTVQGGLSCQM
jgi:Arc/MetJ-type ribon-helix-helix transcriptional regulator